MSKQTISSRVPALPVSGAAEVAGILLAALAGVVGGSVFGIVVARSLLVAVAAAIGGAVGGLIGAAKYFETRND
jgi:membrane associated rhomboid family serine protease